MDNPLAGGKKPIWIIAIGAGVAVGGIMLWKHLHPTPATTTPAVSGYGGYGYSAYGYGTSPIFGYGSGGLGSGFPTLGGGGYGSYGYQGTPQPTTNSQWFQQAIAWLTQNGTSATTAEAALGKYLAGQPVTSQQALIIQEAEGAEGPPPQAGPNGFPPNVNTSGGGGGGNAQNPVAGLHQVPGSDSTGADVSWSPSSGATSYQVKSTKGSVSMTGQTSARIHSINGAGDKGDQATVSVLAEPAAPNARAATVVVHTKR